MNISIELRAPILIAVAAVAAAVLALLAFGGTQSQAIHTGDIGLVAIDVDSTGNTATSVGTVDTCRQISATAGTTVEVDVIVNAIPAFTTGHNGITGYQFDFNYVSTDFNVTAASNLQLINANGGTLPFDFSDAVPDSDGKFVSSFADFGNADPEDGAGILTKLTLEVQAGAATGVSALTVTALGIADANNDQYTITTVQNAQISLGQACPTPTPTPSPTPAPTGTFEVSKDFVPNNVASVTVAVSCTNSATPDQATKTATEAAPASFTISLPAGPANCTATESPAPAGYVENNTACAAQAVTASATTQCTITNTLRSATFTVNKNFIPDNAASVSVALVCTSGAPDSTPKNATEAAPAVFTVTGFNVGATCTATETVPGGYAADQSNCVSVAVSHGGTPNCTITNTTTDTFTVNKDFSDKPGTDTTTVSVTLSCASGTVAAPNPTTSSELNPAVFTVNGFTADPNCTATESPIPTGYFSTGTCNAALVAVGQCTITNTLTTATITVSKDFSDNNTATVTMGVSCDSGSVANTDILASDPAGTDGNATFTVTGFTITSPFTDCTVTESSVTGYAMNPATSTCDNGINTLAHGSTPSCTFVNEPSTTTFTITKDFVPNNAATVDIIIACTGANTLINGGASPLNTENFSEAVPSVVTVTAFDTGDTCTVTEDPVPPGYQQSGCFEVALVQGTTACTVTNTLPTATFTINKDFLPNSATTVDIIIACTGAGTLINGGASPLITEAFSEAAPSVVSVTGFSNDTCTVTEDPVPAGYEADESGCLNVALVQGPISCTITNTSIATYTVSKNFSDSNNSVVTLQLSCTSGAVTNDDATAQEDVDTAEFTVRGITPGATCQILEPSVPSGYTYDGSACDATINPGSAIVCTVNNTLNSGTVTVSKDFVPDDAASVTVAISCSGGTPDQASKSASEAGDAVFTVTGFDSGDTCTVTESPVPAGYSKNDSACANLALAVSGDVACTVTNTYNVATFEVDKDFSNDSADEVDITLNCSSGTVVVNDNTATELDNAEFTINGFNTGATCTATEVVPAGFSANETDCQNVALTPGSLSTCTIINTDRVHFQVYKLFDKPTPISVIITLTCTDGTLTIIDPSASSVDPADFEIDAFGPGTTCTATESVPAGWTADQSFCFEVPVTDAGCVIFNTKITGLPSPSPSPSTTAPPSTTPAPTATATPSPTDAPTQSATPTATASPTASPTETPTESPTETASPTATPIGYVWADWNCSSSANPVDSLLTLRFDAGLSADTGDCPDMGQTVDVLGASLHLWGDADCSGSIDPIDSLKVLRADAGLSVTQAVGCPEIGSAIQLG